MCVFARVIPGVTSGFFGIGILLVSDLLDFWYFGRYLLTVNMYLNMYVL